MPDRLPLRPLALALVLFLVCAYGLNAIRAQNAGYNAYDLTLPDGTPARLVLPGPPTQSWAPALPPGARRPPLVVLTHGIIADKEMMSSLAYTLARHGMAVLTMDWAGHGANANPFNRSALEPEIDFVLHYMRDTYADVIDPDRVALMGHSMGGGVTLAYGAGRTDLDFTVAISAAPAGPMGMLPPNLLLIYADGDLPGIEDRTERLLRDGAGVAEPAHDVTYGSVADGTAVRSTVVPHADHLSILFSQTTGRELVAWARANWPLGEEGTYGDPRLPWLGVILVATLALTCVAVPVFRPWLPALDPQPRDFFLVRLAVIAAAAVLGVLAMTAANPFGFIGVWGGDYLIAYFALVGLLLLLWTAGTGAADWKLFWPDWRATLGLALALGTIVYVLIGTAADATALHLTLPRYRVPLALLSIPPVALMCMTLDALTKKGPLWQAALMSVAGVVILIAVLIGAVFQQLASFAVILVAPVMIPMILLLEIPSLAIYRWTNNYFLSGAFRGILLAVFGAACWPVS